MGLLLHKCSGRIPRRSTATVYHSTGSGCLGASWRTTVWEEAAEAGPDGVAQPWPPCSGWPCSWPRPREEREPSTWRHLQQINQQSNTGNFPSGWTHIAPERSHLEGCTAESSSSSRPSGAPASNGDSKDTNRSKSG